MTRSSVGHSLGLTAKKANRNLSAFAAKYGIREAFAAAGQGSDQGADYFTPFI